MPRKKSAYKNGVRIVRFPGGRIVKFHKPGTKAYEKGAAKKRAAGKRLAKIYGFTKKRRGSRRSNPTRCNPKRSSVTFDKYWSGHGDPKWEINKNGRRQAAGFSTEKEARAWWRENKNLRNNPRVAKTELLHVLQGNYGHGWEDLTAALSRAEIRRDKRDYEMNEGGYYRIIQRRVKKDTNPK